MEAYEKLGLFYLGRELDENQDFSEGPLMLYSSGDLTTHALCVGMTGSGKTGLCVGMLEEAAIDGIPALIIDPKGDMANLALGFPQMRAEDFAPWVNEEEAKRKGIRVEELAAAAAESWKNGLAEWGQTPERIRMLRENSEITVFTPGSTAGEPLSILNLFTCPPRATLGDGEALADLVTGTVSSLLGLLGLDADAMQSREHILLSNLFLESWKNGRDLDLAGLISMVQRPPVRTIGVMDVDAFFPEKDRFQLALKLNNLLASPSFASWIEGFPLDIDRILWNGQGKPRLAIVSIAHLGDSERMFFVSLLLNQLLAWTRRQSGSSGLRAILYMDEIFGYFPPVQNPPSKKPLLTLLKQARAYGLSVVLTTQNPVDLDYKGLANIGTWMIGRLQTENDRNRLLDGLQGMADSQGGSFSRTETAGLIANLQKRCFLLNNVHEDAPVVFRTRWALSYLKGPMSRDDIRRLKDMKLYDLPDNGSVRAETAAPDPVKTPEDEDPLRSAADAFAAAAAGAAAGFSSGAAADDVWGEAAGAVKADEGGLMQVPGGIPSYILPGGGNSGKYRPLLGAATEVYFQDKDKNQFSLREVRVTEIGSGVLAVDWARSRVLEMDPRDLSRNIPAGAQFAALPETARNAQQFRKWQSDLQDYLYRNLTADSYENSSFRIYSRAGEDERSFVIRLREETRALRDEELRKLEDKYRTRINTAAEKVRKAEQTVDREKEQAGDAKRQTMISIGATVLGALLGRSKLGTGTLGRAATAGRSASRAGRAGKDITRAEETLEIRREELEGLNARMEDELRALQDKFDRKVEEYVKKELHPLRRDVNIRLMGIFWEQI